MLKKIFIVLALLVVVFLVVASLQPADIRISRSALISSAPAAVFARVNDFKKWEAWSPWAKLDPNTINRFSGSKSGEGAVFSWSGNSEVGEGVMTITESKPSEMIRIKLEFKKPFEATNDTEFTFTPEGDKTRMTWTMSGKNSFIGKAMGLVLNCDKMVGSQFEKGLANIELLVKTAGGR